MAASDSHLIGNCHKVIDGVSGERERSLIGQTLVSKHKKKLVTRLSFSLPFKRVMLALQISFSRSPGLSAEVFSIALWH